MRIPVNATSFDMLIELYLGIWNSVYELTKKDSEVLKEIIKVQVCLKEKGLEKLLFSQEFNKRYKDKVGINAQSLSNYKKRLLKAKALVEKDGYITVSPFLLPVEELTFVFHGVEQKKQEGLFEVLEKGTKETSEE
jgi:hypothetical protein